jgi:hypothetical protein
MLAQHLSENKKISLNPQFQTFIKNISTNELN